MELMAGGTLGRYRLLERAGAGGMAEVWKAIQPSLDRIVAIKVLPRHLASEPGYLERFQREARAISRLDHQNILGIHDFGEDDGYTYMVMPFLVGGTLSQDMGREWSVQDAVRVLMSLAAALEYAHARGIVHRDVKPSNVLIGEGGRIVLADFGIARMTDGSLMSSAVGRIIGTPAYMSPEQVQGVPATPASDQYSLGILAYEMLTGRRPFEAETPMAVALAHVQRPPPPPRTINSDLSPAVEKVLLKGLAKDPEDRYSSVSVFVTALAEMDASKLPTAAPVIAPSAPPSSPTIPPGVLPPSPPAQPARRQIGSMPSTVGPSPAGRGAQSAGTRTPAVAPAPKRRTSASKFLARLLFLTLLVVTTGGIIYSVVDAYGFRTGAPMPTLGAPELIIILVIILIFGVGKRLDVRQALGNGIREVRGAVEGADTDDAKIETPRPAPAQPAVEAPKPAAAVEAPRQPVAQPAAVEPQPAGRPAAGPAAVPTVAYTVASGDTPDSIAASKGISVEELMAANGWGQRDRVLYEGDKIQVPAKRPTA
jgi:serine/threonine protein kinase/LysM repeat protein